MTWTPAVETNLDFELSTLGTDTANPGWTSDVGSYRIVADTEDGGTKGLRGDNSALTTVSRSLTLPANAKKVRLTAWLGSQDATDQCTAVLYLFNASAELIGGITLGSEPLGDFEQEYTMECVVPADTDSVKLEVNCCRIGTGTNNNNGICASTAVEWFIDAGLTVYETPSFLINGGFELGDTPPTGWEHVSGNGLESTTSAAYVFSGTYGSTPASGATQISQQTVFNVPESAEGIYFYGVAFATAADQGDRMRLRLIFENSAGTELDNVVIWGQLGDKGPTPFTLTVDTIPATTAIIRARAEYVLVPPGSAVNAGIDACALVFTSESGPIDVTPKVRIRRENDTWLQLNPVFSGAGAAGLVPDPVSETDKYLRDDGTWQTPPGGGGGEANTASNIGTGDGVFASKVGIDLEFKSLVAGTNITLTPSADEIEISATGGGGGAVDSVNGQTGVVVLDADDIDDSTTDHKFLSDEQLRQLKNGSPVYGPKRTDNGPRVFLVIGQSIAYGGFPYRDGPYPTNNRMYDYQLISTGPDVYGFVQAPDMADSPRADQTATTIIGMATGGDGDLTYGMADQYIADHDCDVYIIKIAIGNASVTSLEGSHWDNGAFVDDTPGAFYDLLEQHIANARSILSGVTDAPDYPDVLLFTQGATNALKINPLTGAANADYIPAQEWAERVMRLIGMWDNPNVLDYISKENTKIALLDLPPFRSWDYTGDHMRVLDMFLEERSMLIAQGDRYLFDFIHPTGDGVIRLGRDISRAISGGQPSEPGIPGFVVDRLKTSLEYTTYIREADGTGNVTEGLYWRHDTTNDLLIISPTDGSTINWGWMNLQPEDYYAFEETADSNRRMVFRVTGRHTYDPADIYQLRIPVEVVDTGSSGQPRVGEALTSSLVYEGDYLPKDFTQIYAMDGSAPFVFRQNMRFTELAESDQVVVAALNSLFTENLLTVDPDGVAARSRERASDIEAVHTGLTSTFNPIMGGVSTATISGGIGSVSGNIRIWGTRTDSGIRNQMFLAERDFMIYFDGGTGIGDPPATDVRLGAVTVHIDTGTSPQTILNDRIFGSVAFRPTGIAGQTWKFQGITRYYVI